MAPEIPLERQRPAEFVFERSVARKLSEMRQEQTGETDRQCGCNAVRRESPRRCLPPRR
jgi:hypothetical protein